MELVRDDELLSKRAIEWDVRGNQQLSTDIVQKLEQALDENPDLLFVCSQEVGFKERALDVRFSDDSYIFMNPIIKKFDRIMLSREYDRITQKEYIVPRFSNLEIVFQDCLGAIKAIKLEGMSALVMSQALDMLDGVYSHDLGLEILPEFDEASEEEQNALIQEYLNSLTSAYEYLDNELSKDEDTNEQWKAIKYMMAKSKGEVEIDQEKPMSKRKQKMINRFVKSAKQLQNKMKFWNKTKKGENE